MKEEKNKNTFFLTIVFTLNAHVQSHFSESTDNISTFFCVASGVGAGSNEKNSANNLA